MFKIGSVLTASALVLTLCASSAWAQIVPTSKALDALTPVTDDTLKNPADGDWIMGRRTYNG